MHTIYICGNDETICDGYSGDSISCWNDEFAGEYVNAAAQRVRDSELWYREHAVDYEVARTFSDWHGGRFTKFYTRCGLVAVAKDAPQEVIDLAWAADEAGCKARDEYIAEREAEAAKYAAESGEAE